MEITVPEEKVAWWLVCSKCSVSVSKSWTRGLCEGPARVELAHHHQSLFLPKSCNSRFDYLFIIFFGLSFLSGVSCEEQMLSVLGHPACRTA